MELRLSCVWSGCVWSGHDRAGCCTAKRTYPTTCGCSTSVGPSAPRSTLPLSTPGPGESHGSGRRLEGSGHWRRRPNRTGTPVSSGCRGRRCAGAAWRGPESSAGEGRSWCQALRDPLMKGRLNHHLSCHAGTLPRTPPAIFTVETLVWLAYLDWSVAVACSGRITWPGSRALRRPGGGACLAHIAPSRLFAEAHLQITIVEPPCCRFGIDLALLYYTTNAKYISSTIRPAGMRPCADGTRATQLDEGRGGVLLAPGPGGDTPWTTSGGAF
jgi:hypothetical protein